MAKLHALTLVALSVLGGLASSLPVQAGDDAATPIVGALEGRPEGPWPRASPPADLPPVRGHEYFPTMLISNIGSRSFDGDSIMEIPELQVSKRVPMQLDLTAGASTTILFFPLDVLIPPDAPARITVRLWFEAENESVGQGFEVSLPVYDDAGFCTTPTLIFSAGAKDVHAPWDFAHYAFDLCNWSEEMRCVTLAAVDRNTGRPLLQPGQALLTVNAVPTLAGIGFSAGGSSDLACMGPGTSIAFLASFDTGPPVTLPPSDLLPRFTLVWDDGRVETVDGDAQTFAGVNTPRVPPPLA